MSLSSNFKGIYNRVNILTHTFKNPANIFFELFTTSESNLICEISDHEEFTFFPGYGWNSCVCPTCTTNHGWQFNPIRKHCENNPEIKDCKSLKTFYGLSIENIDAKHESFEEQKIEL
jgi:hypothetical protein